VEEPSHDLGHLGSRIRENTLRTSTMADASQAPADNHKMGCGRGSTGLRRPLLVEGLVDCMVRGGSSPLGRIEKALLGVQSDVLRPVAASMAVLALTAHRRRNSVVAVSRVQGGRRDRAVPVSRSGQGAFKAASPVLEKRAIS
jgi:hypothetical protein